MREIDIEKTIADAADTPANAAADEIITAEEWQTKVLYPVQQEITKTEEVQEAAGAEAPSEPLRDAPIEDLLRGGSPEGGETVEADTLQNKQDRIEQKKENKAITFALAAVCMVIAVLTGFFLSSSAIVMPGSRTGQIIRSGADEFAAFVSDLAVYAVGEAAELPKYYVLPLSDDPAPAADRSNIFWEVDKPLGNTVDMDVRCYEDETISVRSWKEVCGYTYVAFSEVKIQHPTQFRRAFAGGSYDSGQRYYPQVIAQTNNAVIAMSADYCNYRDEGLIIHQRKLYRDNTNENLDILLYDSKGDLHIMPHKEVENSNILEEKDIIYTFAFGPALVIDGVVQDRDHIDNYVLGFPASREPRAAIGQLGELHYLLCVVEGRTERLAPGSSEEYDPSGLLVREVAKLMGEKGCINAYAMDGGQTATMVFMGDLVNNVAYGGQRSVSDILYFATAIGEDK